MIRDVTKERRTKGGESGPPKMATTLHWPAAELSFAPYVTWMTYLLMAITGIGYLALTWSTVVLLGGFVTSLQRKDFWSLTAISMMLAARIYQDRGDRLVRKAFELFDEYISRTVSFLAREWSDAKKISNWRRTLIIMYTIIIVYVGLLLWVVACCIAAFLYSSGGPVACLGLALWRIVQRDYESNDGDVSKANLAPALDMFYFLIFCQGMLYIIWLCFDQLGEAFLIVRSRQICKIPRKWANIWLVDYLLYTRTKCWRDPASIEGSTISRYAADLIDSESWDDHFSGLTMLATFIGQGADVSSLLLHSRPRVQKVIDTLGWRRGACWELRKAAACVVAHLAREIHLAQFPGAILCISTLLQDETTLRYWRNRRELRQVRPHFRDGGYTIHKLILVVEKLMPMAREQVDHRQGGDDDLQHKKRVVDEDGGGCNELILQGLTILERLASSHHNCVEISSTPEVLSQIIAPLCSDTLIHGVRNSAWAEIVNGTFKVLHSLIRCPGLTGESLRRDIAASEHAIRNLESILEQSNDAGHQELLVRAIEILTELALDSSTNLTMETKENLMKKQFQIFLDEESSSISKELKATAGTTLALLTTNTIVKSSIVNHSFGRLTEMLDAKNNTTYRMIAARVLENICVRCDLDKERVKDKLLAQVLAELLSNKMEPSQPDEENQQNAAAVEDEQNQNIAPGIDEESQNNAPGNDDENHNISAQEGNTEIQEISSTMDIKKLSDQGNDEQITISELQEALLSLILVIYDKVISTDDFDDAVQKNGLGNGEFVVKLKTIVEENCKETVVGLKIVKLCGQIAASMLQRNQYIEHFKNQGFVEQLSDAKKIMSNLESCILFAGTNLQLKKTATPLFSELEKKVLQLLR